MSKEAEERRKNDRGRWIIKEKEGRCILHDTYIGDVARIGRLGPELSWSTFEEAAAFCKEHGVGLPADSSARDTKFAHVRAMSDGVFIQLRHPISRQQLYELYDAANEALYEVGL